jgi:hypothetical protein
MAAATTATFHLPHSSLEPIELTVKMPALAMAVVPRDAVSALDEKWAKAIGVYVLLGQPDDAEHDFRCYVGQSGTGGLKERLTTHRHSSTWQKSHQLGSDWWQRALIVRSRDEDGFNSAEAGWLEGRLWGVLDSAPQAKLVGKRGDDQTLPKHQRDELEQYVPAITAVLRAIGASPDTPDQQVKPPKRPKKHNATILDLIQAGLLTPGAELRSISSQHEAIALVGHQGDLLVHSETYDSPSGAAVAIVGHEMNGWTFWGFQSGDGTLVPLAALREELDPAKGGEEPPPKKPLRPESVRVDKPRKKQQIGEVVKSGPLKALIDAGVLEVGTQLSASSKDGLRKATVDSDGYLHLDDGSVHQKPSGAARRITGYATNGWTFWHTTIDGNPVSLKTLREQAKSAR